mmetsp:Transcript_21656/g.34220  ORF Transcript_21656/g.34220 Transcript_21656/m.34220 type:complete len:203 (-) Transcript_21656:606-1214(-)
MPKMNEMLGECCGLSKSTRAASTLKWALSCMNSDVLVKIALLVERLRAVWALERSESRVEPLVTVEIALIREGFLTRFTHICLMLSLRSLGSLLSTMPHQIVRPLRIPSLEKARGRLSLLVSNTKSRPVPKREQRRWNRGCGLHYSQASRPLELVEDHDFVVAFNVHMRPLEGKTELAQVLNECRDAIVAAEHHRLPTLEHH